MKKALCLTAVLLTAFTLCSSVSPIVKANPQFLYDSSRYFDLSRVKYGTDEYKKRGSYLTTQDVYYRYYERESFLDVGFRIDDDHFSLVFDIDLRKTLNSFYLSRGCFNIPVNYDSLSDIIDLNFPRYAFGEVKFDNFLLSLGRRPLSWGAGEYQTAISRNVPYIDNIWAQYTTELSVGEFSYNFVLMSFNKLALRYSVYKPGVPAPVDTSQAIDSMKTVAAHRVEWNLGFLRFSMGELNLIYNRCPDLTDIAPFGIYHNLYQDKSNVMAYMEGEWLINLSRGHLRLFAELTLDDFSLPTEGEKGKPTAFAAGGGIQWHVMDTDEAVTMKKNSELYTLSSTTLEDRTGLNLTYSLYFCNPYIYNREIDAGKFTVPLYTDGDTDLFEPNAMYLGFKYGPNSFYSELKAGYMSGRIASEALLGILVRGNGYSINSPYGQATIGTGDIDYSTVYTLNGERMTVYLLKADLRYLYAPGLQIEASLSLEYDSYNRKNGVSLTVGHRFDFMSR